MNPVRLIGMVLMLAGLGGMIWGAADFLNDRKSVEIFGARFSIEDKEIPTQVFIGLGLFAGGVVLTALPVKSDR